MALDFAQFRQSLRKKYARPDSRKRAVYSDELLATAEALHFEDRLDCKAIAKELIALPEYAHISYSAMHGKLCRHMRQVAERRKAKPVK